MDQLTVDIETDGGVDPVAIVLTGPPASGKSTIRRLFSDYGCVTTDLEDHHTISSGEDQIVDTWCNDVTSTLERASEEPPYIACIEGAINENEIDLIETVTDNVLTIRVDVPDNEARIERYVEREISGARGVIDDERIADLETKAYRRHRYERPYPSPDVSIINADDVSTTELSDRCGTIVSLVTDTQYDSLS